MRLVLKEKKNYKKTLKESTGKTVLIKSMTPTAFLLLTTLKSHFDDIKTAVDKILENDIVKRELLPEEDKRSRDEVLKKYASGAAFNFISKALQFIKPLTGAESLRPDEKLMENCVLRIDNGEVIAHDGRHRALAQWLIHGSDFKLTVAVELLGGTTEIPALIYPQRPIDPQYKENQKIAYESKKLFGESIGLPRQVQADKFYILFKNFRESLGDPNLEEALKKFNEIYNVTVDGEEVIPLNAINPKNNLLRVTLFYSEAKDIDIGSVTDKEERDKLRKKKDALRVADGETAVITRR